MKTLRYKYRPNRNYNDYKFLITYLPFTERFAM